MGEVIELSAFRRQRHRAPGQATQRAASAPPVVLGREQGAVALVAGPPALGVLRWAVALWLSFWAAPLGLRVEAKREWAATSRPRRDRSVASR